MIVLASASPRRREILATLGVPFRVELADIDESTVPGEAAARYVERLAREKALAVAERTERTESGAFVLAADTSVVVDGEILGKPRDDDDARRMLRALSGRAHEVLTGIAVLATSDRAGSHRSVCTEVFFRALDAGVIDRYVASGEGRDKAGGYAIQGLGMGLVREIRGSYTNVVGLPAAETLELLLAAGALPAWPLPALAAADEVPR
jgi:septum formation protein